MGIPTRKGDGRRLSGKKTCHARQNNSLEDHVKTITITNSGTAARRVSDITMLSNDWDENCLHDELCVVHREYRA